MNEYIFLIHIVTILLFTLLSLRLGMTALGTWVCIQALCANIFVLKQVELFGFQVTCSDVFAIGSLLGLNLIQEHYGSSDAQKIISHCFYFLLFFAVLSQIHLFYIPSSYDTTQKAYETLLAPAPRLLFASLLTFFLTQRVDLYLFKKLKTYLPNYGFALRTFFSLMASQLLDTIFFTLIGLYGLVHSLFDMILLSFLIKAFIITIFFPLTHLCKKWVQTKEVF
ncbi:MAG: queuosine precursor transporter [Rhabdochlamydiaceae bacterium]|nr:queuosine precursor transporter [Rhabdochlamydiaceae bacterium]